MIKNKYIFRVPLMSCFSQQPHGIDIILVLFFFFFDEKMEAQKYSVTCQGHQGHQFIRGGSGIQTQAF